jgi:hypothetical protein
VASALEPRRNGDGSWTPSTALTALRLNGEWVLILMVVTKEESEAARVYLLSIVNYLFASISIVRPSKSIHQIIHSFVPVV